MKEKDLYDACVKVERIPGLLSHEESIRLKIPRFPKAVVGIGMGFFRELYRRDIKRREFSFFFSLPDWGSFWRCRCNLFIEEIWQIA